MRVEIKVLNQVAMAVDGCPVALGDHKQRILLGILALEGRVVESKKLVRLLWDEDPRPKNPGAQLQGYASRLRHAMDAAVPGSGDRLLKTVRLLGYRLEAGDDDVDYRRFKSLAAKAAAAAARRDPREAARLGRLALAEWGEPAGTRGGYPLGTTDPLLERYIEDGRQSYRNALMNWLQAELACGRHRALLPELPRLTEYDDDSRADEELARLRMLALFRADRTPQALSAYTDLREALTDLGLEPGPQTEELQKMILNQDPSLHLPEDSGAVPQEEPAEPDEDTAPRDRDGTGARGGPVFHNNITGERARVYEAENMTFHERHDEE